MRTAKSRHSQTRMKTAAQVGRIFGLARPEAELRGIETREQIEETIFCNIDRNPRISELTFDEANLIIKAFGGDPFTVYGTSKRTENYRKQVAGVKTIETEAHLHKIHELAAERNMSESGLERLATRMHLPWPPKTTSDGNKIVEALKAMNERDQKSNVAQFPKPAEQPAYRRVA